MNTNDFSRCKVGYKLWSIQLGECEFVGIRPCDYYEQPVVVSKFENTYTYTIDGKWREDDIAQSLYFSNPNIIAPPEPPRLHDYKPGQWIAVWDYEMRFPVLREFIGFYSDGIYVNNGVSTEIGWAHYCSLDELPAVLEKWGEK